MRDERMVGTEPKNRNMPTEDTLRLFEGLLKGENKDFCIRAKIDYQNKNKCMRDPVF